MSSSNKPSEFADAFGSLVWAAIIGGLSLRSQDSSDPRVRTLGLVGLFFAALLAARAVILVVIGIIRRGLRGLGLLLRFYAYRKLFAGMLGVGLTAIGYGCLHFCGLTARYPWSAVIPAALGLFVFLLPDVIERLRATSFVIRQFLSGGKPVEDFAGAYQARKLSASWQSKMHPTAGYLSSARYIGRTLPESTLRSRAIWIDSPVSEIHFCCTGGGKSFDIIVNGCLHSGSMIAASVKTDIAEALIGRRSDPQFAFGNEGRGRNPGVDVRGITQVKKHIPRGRSMLLDPEGSSVYAKAGRLSAHNILSDIDIRHPNAASLIFAVATASVPVNEKASDPFWQNTTRALLAAGIGFVKLTEKDPTKQTLPHVADLLLGIDDKGRCDPDRFRRTMLAMRKINALGGIVQAGASAVDDLGEKAFGAINAEIRNALRWVMLMREHLSRPSDFSYRELGDEQHPLSVFLIQPSLAPNEATPYMQTHITLALSLLKSQPRPKTPIIFVGDEYRQYGKGIDEIASGSMVLRSFGIKLNLYLQNYPALVTTVGEQTAHEICSSSTERYYGVTDTDTAERLCKQLGEREDHRGRYPLVSPQDIKRELDPTSPLQYCLPYAGQPMRLERLAHKPIKTKEGLRLRGLPLADLVDEF